MTAKGRGPNKAGFTCPCGNPIGVRRTLLTGGVIVRYRRCRVCFRSFKSVETVIDDLSVKRLAQAIQRLLVD